MNAQTRAHPARSIALAAGVGFLTGGGLLSALTLRILATGLKVGMRVALVPFVTQRLGALGGGLLARDGNTEVDDDVLTVVAKPDAKRQAAAGTGHHDNIKETNS